MSMRNEMPPIENRTSLEVRTNPTGLKSRSEILPDWLPEQLKELAKRIIPGVTQPKNARTSFSPGGPLAPLQMGLGKDMLRADVVRFLGGVAILATIWGVFGAAILAFLVALGVPL